MDARGLVALLVVLGTVPPAATGCDDPAVPCPDSSHVSVTFTQVFTGRYRTSEPRDVISITPGRALETLASNGITIRVQLRNHLGRALAGIAAQDVVLTHPWVCMCAGGNLADGPTDGDGVTTFTGAVLGGGCAPELRIRALGVVVGAVPVKTNSTDPIPHSPCSIDSGDLSNFAVIFLSRTWDLCKDYNEDGEVDASDLSFWAQSWGASCTPSM